MITAFVPTFNNERTIREVICSLKLQTIQPKKIIIIDSGSTDGTEQIVKEEGCEFYSPSYFGFEFLGLGRARNRILELIDTPYLLSVDSDILLEKDHIEKALPLFDKDETIAGVAGKQIELNRIHIADRARAVVEMRDLERELEPCYKDFLLGSNNIYKVSILKEVGVKENKNPHRPFEDSLISNYEDVDIGIKLRKYGYKLYFDPSIKTYHLQKDTLHSFVNRAYRYRVFKWQLQGAFEDSEIYKKRVAHNINYANMGISMAHEKARYYLVYPFLFAGFNFFLEDIFKFLEVGNKAFANKIYGSFVKSLDFFVSKNIKNAILTDNHYLLEKIEFKASDEIDEEVFERFKELAMLSILNEKFPATVDSKLIKTDKALHVKAIEASYHRVAREQELKIYGDFRVLLLNSPWRKENRYGIKTGSRWPHTQLLKENRVLPPYIPYPFFLAYTFSLLQKHNIASWILDAVAEGYSDDETLYESIGYRPNLIIFETSTPSFYNDLDQIKRIKEFLPECKICLVGSHVSYEKENILSHKEIDFVVVSEYEESVYLLSKALKDSEDFKKINGLIYRENGQVDVNDSMKSVDFGSFENSHFDILPFYNYNDRPIAELKYPSFQVQLSRGCPYKCIFCLWPQLMYKKKYQLRDLNKVLKEIRKAKEIFGIQSFYVDDDTFNIYKNHLLNFATLLNKYAINLPWAAMARADTVVDKETLQALKDSGLIMLKFGIESIDESVLLVMQKGLDIKKCEETIALCKQLNIKVHLTFSIGYFNDSLSAIQKTFDWLIAQNPESMQISIVTPFPGTVMHEQALKQGYILEKDLSKYDGATYSVVTSNIEKDVLESIRKKWIEEWLNFKNNKKVSAIV